MINHRWDHMKKSLVIVGIGLLVLGATGGSDPPFHPWGGQV